MRKFLDGLYEASAWAAGLGMIAILVVTLLQVAGGGCARASPSGTDSRAFGPCS